MTSHSALSGRPVVDETQFGKKSDTPGGHHSRGGTQALVAERSHESHHSFAGKQKDALKDFLRDLEQFKSEKSNSKASLDWIIVVGNTGGETDSLVSALVYANYLHHHGTTKAIGLLQLEQLAVDGRRQHAEVLKTVGLSTEDILSESNFSYSQNLLYQWF